MDKDKRITTIVLDKEADRKSRVIAEFTGKTLSTIYRDALDAYYYKFVNGELFSELNEYLAKIYWKYKIDSPAALTALKFGHLSEVAILIADIIKQLPDEPEAQELREKGIWLIGVLSK